jgi:hypothetical protein
LGVGHKADDLALYKNYVVKYKAVKSGCDLAESYKDGSGSKRVVLPMMMMVTTAMMMMMMMMISSF